MGEYRMSDRVRGVAVGFVVVVGAQCCAMTPVVADDRYYYPAVSGKPAGIVRGTIVGFGGGMASGSLRVRRNDGHTVSLYLAAGSFTVNGAIVDCAVPPVPPTYSRSPEFCRNWPTRLRIGSSLVSVPYWTGTRFGKPTLIAKGLVQVR